jgi:hypothetical protein
MSANEDYNIGDTVMTVVENGSETWVLRKTEEDLLVVVCFFFQRNCLRIFLGTHLTDRISNHKLHEKEGSISFSTAIMRKVKMTRTHFANEGRQIPKDLPF